MNNQKSTQGANSKVAEIIAKSPLPTDSTLKTVELAKKPILVIRQNQIIAGVIGTMGLVLFAFGIENLVSSIPELSSPWIEIFLGFVLLVISGLFLKKLF